MLDKPLAIVRSAALFSHPLRRAIHNFKRDSELAPTLSRYLVVTYMQKLAPVLPIPIDIIIPVPLHTTRLAQRGYNQSELLATPLAAATQIPIQPGWLQRSRYERSQVGLNQQERQINVADAFAASPLVAGRHVLLIDDVYTTGATLNACGEALLQAGARLVSALTLAVQLRADADLPDR